MKTNEDTQGSNSTKISAFGHPLFVDHLPSNLEREGRDRFTELWDLHPKEYHRIRQPMTGKIIPLPRHQQAYGRDYKYTGSVNTALPMPTILEPYLTWVQERFETRLNGLLLNWYDAEHEHYIGAHRDSREGLVKGTSIVTISLGAPRLFRLRPFKGEGFADLKAEHGIVFVMPWDTNLSVKHEVVHNKSAKGQRISITARAFE